MANGAITTICEARSRPTASAATSIFHSAISCPGRDGTARSTTAVLMAAVNRVFTAAQTAAATATDEASRRSRPSIDMNSDLVARLNALRAAIALRMCVCQRDPASITLVAVSKTYSADEVWPTIAEAGQLVFGENRVQEARPKWLDLRQRAAAIG